MIGGQGGGGGSTSDIMTWAKKAGTLVAESKWKDTTTTKAATTTTKTANSMTQKFGGQTSEALYDLKGADTTK